MTFEALVHVRFCRHAEIASHSGDLPATAPGLRHAEAVGAEWMVACPRGARVEFLHAPTLRTAQTAAALRAGMQRTASGGDDIRLGAPRVEHAIRNPDLFVAGTRVEMVSSPAALAAQLPALDAAQVASHDFFSRFWGAPDRIGCWVDDRDPPGERASDVARRLFAFARSLCDLPDAHPRAYVCVTHSGPIRALVRHHVLDRDPGEPEYVEAVELSFTRAGAARWRYRDATTGA